MRKSKEQLVNELKKKYLSSDVSVSKSSDYLQFKSKGVSAGWFESGCRFARKLGLNVSISSDERKALIKDIELSGLNVKPEDVYSFGLLAILSSSIIGVLLLLIIGLPGLLFSLVGFGVFYYLRNYPHRLVEVKQARASSELILAVLYMVIYMRSTSNLENAVKFVADNLETSLSDDFKKMLWDVSAKKYASMKEALDNYVDKWRDYSPVFVDAIHLIEGSLFQSNEDSRIHMLNKALELTLEGTYESMTHYANALRTPINMLYMLGIMLPVLGLVMFPIMGAFMSDIVNPVGLTVLYDFLLPVSVYLYAAYSLAKRPAGFPVPNIEGRPGIPPEGKFALKYDKRTIYYSALIPSLIVFVLLLLPAPLYIAGFTDVHPKDSDVYATLFIPLAPAVAVIVYAKLITKDRLKVREKIALIESEFAEAAFQLGNRLSEGYPLEIALLKVASTLKGTETARFFKRISKNIRELGMDVESAVFDRKRGALKYYPSAIIKSVMRVAIMGAKKSLDVAAISLVNMSSYLRDVHRIDEKVKDILSETLSSMKFQASFLAPVISGLVVGLTAMILIILDILGLQVSQLSANDVGGFGGGTWVLGIFEVSKSIPLYAFQPIVGIYVFEIILLLSIIDAKIELGGDKLFSLKLIGSMMPIGFTVYVVTTFAVTIIFTGIARLAVTAGVAFG